MSNEDIPQPGEPKAGQIKKPTRHLRAPIEIRIEITLGLQSFTTTSRNLAIGGISFESLDPLEVGDNIHVLLYVPVNKDIDLIKISSQVVWVQDQDGSWMIGAKFIKFAPGDHKKLKDWLLACVKAIKEGNPIV